MTTKTQTQTEDKIVAAAQEILTRRVSEPGGESLEVRATAHVAGALAEAHALVARRDDIERRQDENEFEFASLDIDLSTRCGYAELVGSLPGLRLLMVALRIAIERSELEQDISAFAARATADSIALDEACLAAGLRLDPHQIEASVMTNATGMAN